MKDRAKWVLAVLAAAVAMAACAPAQAEEPEAPATPPTESGQRATVPPCDAASPETLRCKALLTFSTELRVYLDGIPVTQADNVPGAIAAYFPGDDRIEWSRKLPRYGERWAMLTMRHEFVHALTWNMPEYRSDALAGFVGLRAAIAAADGEREDFPKYDQWLRARPEFLDDLPHFFTGIVELMHAGELPASLDEYFAPVLKGGSETRLVD